MRTTWALGRDGARAGVVTGRGRACQPWPRFLEGEPRQHHAGGRARRARRRPRGIDLLALPQGTELHIGAHAVLRITGLRNPCAQIDTFQRGLMAAVLGRASDGSLVRKTGVMAVVVRGGVVAPGDALTVVRPAQPWQALAPV